jgi:hypothetical protein
MSLIVAAMSGPWSDPATWGLTQDIPTENDTVLINNSHTVTLDTDVEAEGIRLARGGLVVADGATPNLAVSEGIQLACGLAPMPLRLDGATFRGTPCCIGAYKTGTSDGFPSSAMIMEQDGVIIDDTGIYNASATLQDIKPEGCGRAYARKIGNAVRYLTLTVRIARAHESAQAYIRYIYDWAEGPFQVLAINGSCAIKGYIESAVYDKTSIGTAYHVLQVTIAEGEQ